MSAYPGDAGPLDPGLPEDSEHRETGPPEGDPTLDELRSMWDLLDPVPTGLADRVGFALEVEGLSSGADDLDLELMRLVQEESATTGSRGDQVRTITFGSESATVMLALTDVEGGFRVDGWVAPGGRRQVGVRTGQGSHDVESDETGRFTVPLVPPGHFQLVLGAGTPPGPADATGRSGPGAAPRAVVTPALTL